MTFPVYNQPRTGTNQYDPVQSRFILNDLPSSNYNHLGTGTNQYDPGHSWVFSYGIITSRMSLLSLISRYCSRCSSRPLDTTHWILNSATNKIFMFDFLHFGSPKFKKIIFKITILSMRAHAQSLKKRCLLPPSQKSPIATSTNSLLFCCFHLKD